MGFHNNTASGVESYKKMLLNDILDATEYLTKGTVFDRDGVRLGDDMCSFILINKENQILSKLVCWDVDLMGELRRKLDVDSLGEMRVETLELQYEMVYGVTLNPTYISYYIDNLKNK